MMKYSSKDLAIIIPTKDRPKQIYRHLMSLVDQNCELDRVIVVDSGKNIEEIVLSFKDRLPVEYYKSQPGQVRQRNLGISMLNDTTNLVAWMDDDVTYYENSINHMIKFWNLIDSKTVGVGFNMIYQSKNNFNIFKLISNKLNRPGSIKKSGQLTPFSNLTNDIEVQYLSGGATVWKYDIIKKYKHDDNLLDLKWAACEDWIYSYPIGKKFKLMACASSKVQTEDEIRNNERPINYYIDRGKIRYSMRLYFVLTNSELSRILFFFSQLLFTIKLLSKLILYLDLKYLYEIHGTTKGILINLDVLFSIQHPNKLVKKLISKQKDQKD